MTTVHSIFEQQLPDDDSPQAAPYNARRGMVASGQRLDLKSKSARKEIEHKTSREWQAAAWDYYDAIGEVRFAFNLMASVVSRIRLFPAVVAKRNEVPTEIADWIDTTDYDSKSINALQEACYDALDQLDQGFISGGLSEMCRLLALNFQVAGEMFLVSPKKGQFKVASVTEVSRAEISGGGGRSPGGSGLILKNSRDEKRGQDLRKDAYIARIWRPHPRWSKDADCSMLGVLDNCEKLILLDRAIRATARSRMHANLMFIPDDISVTPSEVDGSESDEESVEAAIIEGLTATVSDEASIYSIVPLMLRGPGESGALIRLIEVARTYDPELAKAGEDALGRVLSGIDVPKDVVTGLANVKYCLSSDTLMLTRTGWRSYDEVEVGDEILTLNHQTGMSEWQPLQAVNVFDVEPGEKLLRMDSRAHHSVSTAGHCWPTIKVGRKVAGSRRRWTTSGEGFTSTDRIETAVPCADLPLEAKYTDDFVRLVALYTSDGSLQETGRRWVRIGKVWPDEISAVRTLLTRLFGPPGTEIGRPSWVERSDQGTRSPRPGAPIKPRTVFLLNEEIVQVLSEAAPGKDKVITESFILSLTSGQLEVFFQALLSIGDGCIAGSAWVFHQMNKDRLRAIELAAILSGRTPRWRTYREPTTSRYGVRSKGLHSLVVSTTRTMMQPGGKTRHEWSESPEGTKVFCPTTANHTWLAKFEGTVFYTGNSNAIVLSDDLYRAHVEPLVMAIADALTTVYFRPFLRRAGITEKLVRRAVIWYDPSAVVTRPDRSTAANEGYDRKVLSGVAWRKARGFAESDKPSDEELLERMAFEDTVLPPDTGVALIEHYAPEVFAEMRNKGQKDSGMPKGVSSILNGNGSDKTEPGAAPENLAPKTAPNGPEGSGGGKVAPGGTRPPTQNVPTPVTEGS